MASRNIIKNSSSLDAIKGSVKKSCRKKKKGKPAEKH